MEATIAVMIVAGVMISVYSEQTVREDTTIAEYSYSLQSQILEDIASDSDWRIQVLNVSVDDDSDPSFVKVNEFVAGKIPNSFGHSLRICNLSDPEDFCKMRTVTFVESMDSDVYVEEIVVSAEIGNGSDVLYGPKRVVLFFWEGEGGVCIDTTPIADICGVTKCGSVNDVCGNSRDCSGLCEGSCVGDVCEVAQSCTDTCSSLGFNCEIQSVCGVATDCGSCSGVNEVCNGGVCEAGVASLSATITMAAPVLTLDSTVTPNCYYNKCYYDVNVVNSGSVAGTVWKRVVSGDASATEIYNQEVAPSGFFNIVGKYGASKCFSDQSYVVDIYDGSSSVIGTKSFTCLKP